MRRGGREQSRAILRVGLGRSHLPRKQQKGHRSVKRSLDDSLQDLLKTVREAEAQHKPKRQRSKLQVMSKPDRERYLRSRGWHRLSTSGVSSGVMAAARLRPWLVLRASN